MCAEKELHDGDGVVFENGEVEVDGTTLGTIRSDPDFNIHTGRILGFKERATGKTVFTKMPDQKVKKGDPPVPECYEEVHADLTRCKDGSILCADGAGGFKKAKRLKAVPEEVPLSTVRHSNKPGQPKQFTKFDKVPVEKASKKLTKASQMCL